MWENALTSALKSRNSIVNQEAYTNTFDGFFCVCFFSFARALKIARHKAVMCWAGGTHRANVWWTMAKHYDIIHSILCHFSYVNSKHSYKTLISLRVAFILLRCRNHFSGREVKKTRTSSNKYFILMVPWHLLSVLWHCLIQVFFVFSRSLTWALAFGADSLMKNHCWRIVDEDCSKVY